MLETLGRVTAIAFDKTGTLTAKARRDRHRGGRSPGAGRAVARSGAGEGVEPSVALAILDRAKADNAPVPPAFDANAVPGEGVEGKVAARPVFLGRRRPPRAALPRRRADGRDRRAERGR